MDATTPRDESSGIVLFMYGVMVLYGIAAGVGIGWLIWA